MKKIYYYLISIVVSVLLIFIIKPYVDEYKMMKQYDFEVSHISGKIKKDDFKGKVLAIYFGYMFCPDICPTSLSSLASALSSFDEKKVKNNFKGLFISVDPDRDKLKNLDEYAKYFHDTFMGSTSNKANIDDIVKRYGTHYKKVPLKNSAIGYSVAHTSYIYFFDKEGKFIAKVDHFSNPEQLKEVLKKIL